MKVRSRTAPEVIATHLCWEMGEVSEGRYQNTANPGVYVCGDDYYCAPTSRQKLPSDWSWECVGEQFGRKIYCATA